MKLSEVHFRESAVEHAGGFELHRVVSVSILHLLKEQVTILVRKRLNAAMELLSLPEGSGCSGHYEARVHHCVRVLQHVDVFNRFNLNNFCVQSEDHPMRFHCDLEQIVVEL